MSPNELVDPRELMEAAGIELQNAHDLEGHDRCQRCWGQRVAGMGGKVSDRFSMHADGHDHHDYVPYGLNVGGGDYLEFDLCLECGAIQGGFPVTAEQVRDAVHGP